LAIDCFDQAICLNPDYAEAFNGKGNQSWKFDI
jgi:hypothetical protein